MNDINLLKELEFKFARSGGAGGQHVNKVSSKVLLQWSIYDSQALSEEEKVKLALLLKNRINKDGILQLDCDTDRSQLKNKKIVSDRFFLLIATALAPIKARKKTKIPYNKIINRLDRKSKRSDLKKSRGKQHFDF